MRWRRIGGGINSTSAQHSTSASTASAAAPPPPATILSAATTSQEFASKGTTFEAPEGRSNPLLSEADQLKLRYDASSNTYEIKLPAGASWSAISPSPDGGLVDGEFDRFAFGR